MRVKYFLLIFCLLLAGFSSVYGQKIAGSKLYTNLFLFGDSRTEKCPGFGIDRGCTVEIKSLKKRDVTFFLQGTKGSIFLKINRSGTLKQVRMKLKDSPEMVINTNRRGKKRIATVEMQTFTSTANNFLGIEDFKGNKDLLKINQVYYLPKNDQAGQIWQKYANYLIDYYGLDKQAL